MYKPMINEVFDALGSCKLFGKNCTTGTARAEHARRHVRAGQAVEVRYPDRKFLIVTK